MYSAIIFDFFDVIRTDPYKVWLKRHDIKRDGQYAEAADDLDRGYIDLNTFHERLHRLSGRPVAELEREYQNTLPNDPGMVNFITKLGKNYKLGLLSNAESDYLRNILRAHGLEKLFDVVVISSETGLIKPTPEAFHDILKKLGAKPEETIFIDDYDFNVEAAHELSITALQYTNLSQLKHDLVNLNIIVD
jgi:putative hydrolase of the HAD superfamily